MSYLTPDEVDELLKLPRGKAQRLAKRGKLPAIILADGTVRFAADALTEYLAIATAYQAPNGAPLQPA